MLKSIYIPLGKKIVSVNNRNNPSELLSGHLFLAVVELTNHAFTIRTV